MISGTVRYLLSFRRTWERLAAVEGADGSDDDVTGRPRADAAVSAVVLIGAGSAAHQHADALRAAGLRLHGFYDRDPATDLPGGRRLTEQDLTDMPSGAALALCIPPGERTDSPFAALAQGVPLMVEKPPHLSLAGLTALAEASAAADVEVGVMLQHRGLLTGVPPGLNLAECAGTVLVSRPRAEAHWRAASWRTDLRVSGGGAVTHLGIHYLDLACLLLGWPVSCSALRRAEVAPGVDTRVEAVLHFDSGADLHVLVTTETPVSIQRLTLLASRDWLVVENGAVSGSVRGTEFHRPPVSAAKLRETVYRQFVAATGPGPAAGPRSAGLEASRPTMAALELLSGRRPTVARDPRSPGQVDS